jgi:hypothetical protein
MTQEQTQEQPASAYFGPSLPGKMLQHGQIFKNGELPAALVEQIKDIPGIMNLIVSQDWFAVAHAEETRPGSLIHSSAQNVKKWIRDEVKRRFKPQAAALEQQEEKE